VSSEKYLEQLSGDSGSEATLEEMLRRIDELTSAKHFMATEPLLDGAVSLFPANPHVRLRRAALYGRLTLYDKAKTELATARRYLAASDVQGLVYAQEFDRWLREQSRSSFTRPTSFPRLPGWISALLRKKQPVATEIS